MKHFLLIKSNLKKSFRQIVVILCLFLLSSVLISLLLTLKTDYRKTFDRDAERLNSEDITLVCNNLLPADVTDSLHAFLDQQKGVSAYEIDDSVSGFGNVTFRQGLISKTFSFLSYSQAVQKQLGRYEILEEIPGDGVLLSYMFQSSGDIRLGDEIVLELNGRSYSFTVKGFYNNPTTGSVHCIDIVFLLSDTLYESFRESVSPSYRICLQTESTEDPDVFLTDLTKKMQNRVPSLSILGQKTLQKTKDVRYVNATMFETILTLASVLLVGILLIITVISLSNYIKNSIRELGTLKAIGYSSGGIIFSLIAQFGILALVMSLLGSSLSFLILPLIVRALESQVGIPYSVHFVFSSPLLTSLLLVCLTVLTTLLTLRTIRTIEPIFAIRDHRKTSDPQAKAVPLTKTVLPVNTVLGLKTCFSNPLRNLILLLAITAVGYLAGFGCSMYQNILQNTSGVIELVCGQTADSALTVTANYETPCRKALRNSPDVEDFYLYTLQNLTPEEHAVLACMIVEDPQYLNRDLILLEGELPSTSKDICLNAAYAERNHLSIGDSLDFIGGTGKVSYTVCGLSQGAYYSGDDAYMTRKGLERMTRLFYVSFYVRLKEGISIEDFHERISAEVMLTDKVNLDVYFRSMAGIYTTLLEVLTVVILLVSALIITFVLYVILSLLLANKRRENGILKALGFTSRDILTQTMLSILPTCVIAVVLGLLLAKNTPMKLLSFCLRSIGIYRFGEPTRTLSLFLAGLSLICFSCLFVFLLSRSIRKITPHELFNNE